MFPPVFQKLKASAQVLAVVGTDPPRIYEHGNAPQRPDKLPLADAYISWFAVAGYPENHLSGTPPTDRVTVQLDCWAPTSRTVKTLAIAARDAIEPYAHMTGMPVDTREPDTKLFRIALQFDWFVAREVVVAPPDSDTYAKPKAHAIFYNSGSTWSEETKAAMAKYASVQMVFELATGASTNALAASIADVRSRNPEIEFFAYSMTAEAYTAGYDFGGTYGDRAAKLKAANWFVRNAAGQRLRGFGGTLPAYPGNTFLTERGDWATAKALNPAFTYNDVVTEGGIDYLCIVPHTSVASFATDLAANRWSTNLGIMAVNYCPGSLPDHAGVDWATWYANHVWTYCNRAGVVWDGIYLDHYGYTEESELLDWQNVGANVRMDTDAPTKRDAEAFLDDFIANLKTAFGNPDLKIIGNVNSGALGDEFITTRGMGAKVDGMLHETTVAPSVNWSNITFAGINNNGINAAYYSWIPKSQSVKNPADSYSSIGVRLSHATDYATARLGIALALFRDARVTFAVPPDGYGGASLPWFDELDQQLGAAIDPVVGNWTGSMAKRRFENGVVIVNSSKLATGANRGAWAPHTTYAQGDKVLQGGLSRTVKYGRGHTSAAAFATDDAAGRWHTMTGSSHPALIAGAPITIDSAVIPAGVYRRFVGTQDPAQNSGAVVNGSFQLAGWDAIVLLCVVPGVHA